MGGALGVNSILGVLSPNSLRPGLITSQLLLHRGGIRMRDRQYFSVRDEQRTLSATPACPGA